MLIIVSCDLYEPTEETWSKAKSRLKEITSDYTLKYHSGSKGEASIDYFKTNGKWCFAVVSSKNDSLEIYQAFVGYVDPSAINYQPFRPTRYLTSDHKNEYDSLKASGSLWSLFVDRPNWGDRKYYEHLLDSLSHTDRDGDGISDPSMRSFGFRKTDK